MAKKAEVIITCDASTVKKVLEGINNEIEKTKRRRQELQEKQRTSIGLTKTEEKELQGLIKYENALNERIPKITGEMKKYGEVMKDLAGSKTKDLKKALREVKQSLENMAGNDPKRQQLVKDLKKIQAQIDANTGALKKQGTALSTTLKNLVAYAGVFAGFNKIKSLIEGVFQSNLKLSDSLANIRKVSGLTMKDINQLYGNISKIDTRNTIETLNELAYTGAKLGIAEHGGTQALTGFVKAAEQVQMALGEDLGDEALPALAKLTEVMGLMDRYGVEQAMQKAASSIFQLGATSTATGKNIVEVSKRLMGLANVSRISADELLAIGSASDAMGLMPEVAATAFNKLFTAVQQKHNLIEKTLDLPKGRINYWFEQGKTMNAIVEIFDAMNKRGNMNALDGVFKDLGSDGARLVAVMTTMADRVDILKDHLKTSTKAFKEGEAVIGEYMIQNETANALMERASNLWAKAFTNPEGVTMVQTLAKEWYKLSKEMTSNQATMLSLKMTIEAVALALRTVISLAPFLIKAFAWGGVLSLVRGVGFGIAALVTQLRAATGAAMTLQVALKSNWVLAGVSAVLAGMTMLYEKSQAAAQAAEAARERQAELDKQLAQSKDTINSVARPLERYKASLDKANYSEEQRNKLLREYLAGNYQDYLDYLGIEIDKTLDLAKAYNMVVKTMKQKKAYEERESYRTEVNGTNRMERIAAGMEFEREAKRVGLEGVDRKWIEQNQAGNTMDIYMRLMRQRYGQDVKMFNYDRLKDVTKVHHSKKGALGITKLYGDELGDVDLWNAIVHFQNSYRKERNLNRDVDDMFKDMVGDYDPDAWEKAILEAQLKRKGGLSKEKPDPAAIAAAKKAAQDRKKALKLEMDEAQKASTGIISKLEEYYRLQEAAINDARADGQLTEEQAKEMVRALNIVKNESLATARRAVTTGETKDWDELKTKVLPAVMSDTSEVSRNLLSTIQQVAVDKLHTDLEKFNGSSDVLGLDSRAFFDQMNAKAAGNTREAARLRAKIQNEVEKALLQYQFVEKANLQMRKDLEAIGITTETYEQWAKRMQQGITEKPAVQLGMRSEQREQMYRSFEAYGEQTKGPKDAEGQYSTADKDIVQWVQQWSQQADNAWMKGLPQLDEWLSDTDKYEKQIADFYRTLLSIYEGYKKQIQQSGKEGADFLAFTQGQQQVSDATAQLDKMFGRSITDKEAYREMGNKFVDMGVINFRYNIENQQEAEQWLNDFATTSAGELEDWAQAFPELVEWINLIKRKEHGETLGDAERQALEDAMPAIRNLFNEMMRHADRLDKAMKDAFQHEKETQESRFRVSGYKDEETKINKYYVSKAKQEQTGAGQTFAQQLGLGSIANDPEILQIQNRIYWRNKEVEDARARLDEMKAMQQEHIDMLRENGATEDEIHALEMQNQQDRAGLEQLLMDRQAALTEQTTALTTKTMQELQKRVTAVQNLTKPFSDAAKNIGQKFGEMIRGAEEDSMTWNEIWHNMLMAVGESVIQMGAQYAQNLIMQQAMNRASEAETAAHTTAEVTAGIAAGSAKTIGTLGWWGIPLIAVISSLLMGLLQGALSTNRSSKSSETSTKAATKTKLVSGMLTYDKGNVDRFGGRRKLYDDGETQVYGRKHRYVGDDGRVYTATDEPSPRTGLVTRPIATTVQGQPALVAERGPEIVIGRETTQAIMMNEPELLQHLIDIDRNRSLAGSYSAMAARAAFDEGTAPLNPPSRGTDGAATVSDASASGETTDRETRLAAALEQSNAALRENASAMLAVREQLKQPVHINMYGETGLRKQLQKADRTMSRYDG